MKICSTKRKVKLFLLQFFCAVCLLFTGIIEGAIIDVPIGGDIQAAIDSATDGDTIQLAEGTYTQEIQVVSKDLTILGAGRDLTVIQAPDAATHLTQNFTFGANYYCVVIVDNQDAPTSHTVDISDLTVDGNNQQDTVIAPIYGNSDRFFAIGYHNANGTITNVHTTNTRQTSNFNELAGGGIIGAADTGDVIFNVTGSLVDFYQRIGIDCRGSVLVANITNNEVNRGYVLTPSTTTATPNGIQFSGSATGNITDNIVESNIATVVNASGSGIIIFGAGPDVTVSGNTANNNDYGIVCVSTGGNLTIHNNTLGFTDDPGVNIPEGIAVQDTDGLTVISSNTMEITPGINMDLASSTDQDFQLSDNQFNGSQTGLLVTGNIIVGPVVTFSNDAFTDTAGYYVQEAASPNNIWPSTASVRFDGLISGEITMVEFDAILAKIYDQHNDPTLGLVLDYIEPPEPMLTSISPASGNQAGGENVTIYGSGFVGTSITVNFGANEAASTVIDANTISATAPAGSGIVDVTVTTPFGVTPIVSEDEYTYEIAPLLPPTNFNGDIITQLHKSWYVLQTTWTGSISPDVVLYRVYFDGILVDEVLAGFPLNYSTCISTKLDALLYTIVSVNIEGEESAPIDLVVIHE